MDKVNSFEGLRLTALKAKGYTAEQIAALAEAIEELLVPLQEHTETAHAPANAEENIIVSIKRNGKAVAPVDKIVDMSVPTKVSELTNDSSFVSETAMEEAIHGAGHLTAVEVETVPTAAQAQANVIYCVRQNDGTGNRYMLYKLISGAVSPIGAAEVDLSNYVQTEDVGKAGDALIQSIVNTTASSDEKYVGTGNLALFWSLIKPMVASDDAAIGDLTARVELLELVLLNGEIEGNPFVVTFESLDGVSVAGVWNKDNNRIDF